MQTNELKAGSNSFGGHGNTRVKGLPGLILNKRASQND
jgi:hypothetical protein